MRMKNPLESVKFFRSGLAIGVLFGAIFFALPASIFPRDEAKWEKLDQLVGDLEGSDGEKVGNAIRSLLEMEEYDILRNKIPALFDKNDPEITTRLLKGFQLFGMKLERHFPTWHLFVMDNVNSRSPADHIITGIELAGFWREHRLMPFISSFAVHPSFEIRKATFSAMARMGNDTIIPVLLSLLTSEKPIERIYGLEGAVFYKDNRIMPFALKLLDDPVRSVRVFAVLHLGSQESSDSISHLIVRNYRSDDDPEVREAVIEMIRKQRWQRHGYILHRAVMDPSPEVRRAALKGVRELGESRAAPNISRNLLTETDPELKKLSLDVLVSLGLSGGGDGIEYLLRNDLQPQIRLAAATAAGILADRSLSDSLLRTLKDDPSAPVRTEAAYALGRIGFSSFLDTLEETAVNENEIYEVRSAALASYLQIRGRGFSFEGSQTQMDEALLAAMNRVDGDGEK